MKIYALRLKPNQDLKNELIKFTLNHKIKAGFIVTCVGSLRKATLRLADEKISKNFIEKFEIVSLVGTLCPEGVHLHLSLADRKGNQLGGHLKEGCLIYTTAEIIIGESFEHTFTRKLDEETKFKELIIHQDNQYKNKKQK